MHLRNKLILSFIFIVFIPVIIVGGFLTNELKKLALEDAKQQAVADIQRVRERTLEVLKVPVYISNNILIDQQLKQIVNKEYKTRYDVVTSYRGYNVFKQYRKMYQEEISSIRFYIENKTILNNWEIIPVSQKVKDSSWYTIAQEGKGLSSWLYIEDETYNDQRLVSLVRKIDYPENSTFGVLVISVNPKSLDLILSQESQPIMIVDEHNNIISTNQIGDVGKYLNKVIYSSDLANGKSGIFQVELEGKPTYIFVDSIVVDQTLNQLKIVSFTPDEEIVGNAKQFGKMGIVVAVVGLCVALLLIYYMSNLLTKRLIRLSEQVNQVGKGNFNTHISIDGKDEIGQLSKQLKVMVENTNHLINEVYESNRQKSLLERKQNEIKFKMMASQINPHFLFNALESIRMKAYLNGEKEISQVVKLLGKLMRNSIEVGSGKVKLISEMEVVKSYLEIQKFRYGSRLDFEIVIDPLSKSMTLPPLIIQPLVENAVIHGMENNENGVIVSVHTQMTKMGLLVKVKDNGVGISEQKIDEISLLLSDQEKEGDRIGLRNVHQRLQLSYGKNSGLMIYSKEGKGTEISFFIPSEEEVGCLE
ncbi:hypothetical protein WQ54_09535 [Bacillus sp. SA1-12]|uniref:sensor histidine kinase n=1 Tax=Bacillus sp. SA1-12 TaxID=1455638 RepID=UPI000626334D|nr:sensor histidine kinase [Bacillus sp. SA1-12]KKI92405.1 hypothetical protein WQ54_09535 [Bacillus sp. SA1-12]